MTAGVPGTLPSNTSQSRQADVNSDAIGGDCAENARGVWHIRFGGSRGGTRSVRSARSVGFSDVSVTARRGGR